MLFLAIQINESIDSVIVDVMQQDNYVVFKFMALQVLFNEYDTLLLKAGSKLWV